MHTEQMIARHPDVQGNVNDPLIDCIHKCYDCAQAWTPCLTCSEECDKHADEHEHCEICAEACNRCADACRSAAASILSSAH